MNDQNDFLFELNKYDIISFDVFDTLLIRDVKKPTDIFRISYGFWGRYYRVFAEIIARIISPNGEVSISDIQRFCPFNLNKEIESEFLYCRRNPFIYEIYNKLVNSGKKIYAISDMYLGSDIIGEMLSKAGYDIPVIVSSEKGVNKTSGKLFEVLLKNNDIKNNELIHIGDNYKSDVLGANRVGIKTIQIKEDDFLSYTKINKSNMEIACFINHGLNYLENPIEKIGYEVVGPLILSFCQWIHKKYEDEKFETLYFLARDMKFTYEIYKHIYPEDNIKYLFVSRKSFLFSRENQEELIEYLKKEKFFGNIAIVDTGWLGNAQVEIEKYAKMIDENSDVGGLYLGLKLTSKIKKRSMKTHCFLAPSFIWKFKCELIAPFMETLIGSNDKQVISYKKGNPVFDRDESRDKTNLLKEGARKFIFDWLQYKYNKEIYYKNVRKVFYRIFKYPKRKDMELLGNLRYEDFKDTCILSYVDNYPYLKNIDKWFSDLSYSGWKGAFIKKSFGPFYLPILFLYLITNSFRNIIIDFLKILNNEL